MPESKPIGFSSALKFYYAKGYWPNSASFWFLEDGMAVHYLYPFRTKGSLSKENAYKCTAERVSVLIMRVEGRKFNIEVK